MARIRTLKPEFWNSPSTAQADLAVRLTFMAMWNWADDSGHGTANLKELEAFCWPNDDVRDLPRGKSGDSRGNSAHWWRNFAEICGEVAEVYGVTFYRVAGRPYYEIANFKKHQSKDYRKESRYPLPDEGEIYDVTSGNALSGGVRAGASGGDSAGGRGNSAGVAGDSGIGTGEQGNRGTGEQGKELARPSGPSVSRFDEFWSIYPRKVGKQTAVGKYKAAVKRAGDEQTVIDGAQRLASDPNLPEKKYIPHPTTWLERDGWEDEPLPSSGRDNTHAAWSTPKGYDPADWLRPSNEPAFDYIDAEVVQLREIGR